MALLTLTLRRRRDAKLERLTALPLFQGCNHEELMTVAGLMEAVVLPAGSTLAREGEAPRQAFLVLAGRVGISCAGRPVGEAGPGTPVGTTALLDRWRDNRTVVALDDVEALVVTRPALTSLLRSVPFVARPLLGDVRTSKGAPPVATRPRPTGLPVTP